MMYPILNYLRQTHYFFFLLPITIICFGPIFILLSQSFFLEGSDSETFQYVLKNMVPTLFSNTLSLVSLTCFFSLIIGTVAAILTQLTNLPFRKVFDTLFIIPLSFPLYVLSFIYVGTFEYSAPLLTFFREYFNLNLHPYIPIKSVWGVSFVFSLGLFPYTYLFIRTAIKSSASEMILISRTCGKTPLRILFSVLIPLLRPWFLAAFAITAMETLADFGGVSAFNYQTFTTAIYQAWGGFFSLPTSARLSTFLVFIAIIFFFIEWAASKKTIYAHQSSYNSEINLWNFTIKGKIICFFVAFLITTLSLIFPLYQLTSWAIQSYQMEWSQNYFNLLSNTIQIGLFAAIFTTILALIMTSLKRLQPSFINKTLISLSLLGYSLPGNIIAIAAFLFLGLFASQTSPLLSILILALTIRFVAVAYRSHDNRFKNLNLHLESSAKSLGASNFTIFTKIHLPLMRQSLFLGAILIFLEVIKEMPITLMLRPFHYNTLSVKIYELTIEGEWERASLAGLFLVSSGIVFSLLYARYGNK